jgi:hypothetical protein
MAAPRLHPVCRRNVDYEEIGFKVRRADSGQNRLDPVSRQRLADPIRTLGLQGKPLALRGKPLDSKRKLLSDSQFAIGFGNRHEIKNSSRSW